MKKGISVFILLLALAISGCNSTVEKNKESNYELEKIDNELNAALRAKIGEWAQEGVECYGVVVGIDSNGIAQNGTPIKAKIIRIKKDKIKMKALETINIGPKDGCSKMSITYGQSWWELEGDIFQTLDEAIEFLRKQGL